MKVAILRHSFPQLISGTKGTASKTLQLRIGKQSVLHCLGCKSQFVQSVLHYLGCKSRFVQSMLH